MTLQIALSSATEKKLREKAAAVGQAPAAFVEQLLETELAAADDDDVSLRLKHSTEQRIAELNAWAAMNPALPYEADDSRETIYEGRGE